MLPLTHLSKIRSRLPSPLGRWRALRYHLLIQSTGQHADSDCPKNQKSHLLNRLSFIPTRLELELLDLVYQSRIKNQESKYLLSPAIQAFSIRLQQVSIGLKQQGVDMRRRIDHEPVARLASFAQTHLIGDAVVLAEVGANVILNFRI